jgi:hypothetical protein
VHRDEKPLVEDLALIQRAVREGWPVPEDVRWAITVGLERILDESTDAREVARAARVLIDMDRANMRDEERAPEIPAGPK